jgi:hypothetical protein
VTISRKLVSFLDLTVYAVHVGIATVCTAYTRRAKESTHEDDRAGPIRVCGRAGVR